MGDQYETRRECLAVLMTLWRALLSAKWVGQHAFNGAVGELQQLVHAPPS